MNDHLKMNDHQMNDQMNVQDRLYTMKFKAKHVMGISVTAPLKR